MCSLKVRFSQSLDIRGVFNYALKVEVVSSKGMPSKIFVYHQSPAGIDGNSFAEFDHVATPVDLHEIPEDAASDMVPWYRTDKCVVWLRSLSDVKTAKQLFVDDIGALQKNCNLLTDDNNFTNQTTVEFEGGAVTTEEQVVDKVEEALKAIDAAKVGKNALAGTTVSVDDIDGLRAGLASVAGVLGADVKFS